MVWMKNKFQKIFIIQYILMKYWYCSPFIDELCLYGNINGLFEECAKQEHVLWRLGNAFFVTKYRVHVAKILLYIASFIYIVFKTIVLKFSILNSQRLANISLNIKVPSNDSWSCIRGPMTPYTPLNIANIHNIDLIPATPSISSDSC